jgi:Bifunctional DNA primase/polymerase, N-terminal
MTMLEIALDYAAGGALVLPLHTPTSNGCSCRNRECGRSTGKHPRTMRGLHEATSDPAEVTRWWGLWPNANIGLRPQPGHIVLDVDIRHGGADQLVAIQDRHGKLPTTRTAVTGNGWHLWFGFTGDAVKELAPGLDIKDDHGYVVGPPSLHASGKRYEWTNSGPIADAPPYLRSLLARPPTKTRPVTGQVTPAQMAGLIRVVAEAPAGTRNNKLFWACCRAAEKGLDVAPLVEAAVNNGLSRAEADATAESAAAAPPLRAGGAA